MSDDQTPLAKSTSAASSQPPLRIIMFGPFSVEVNGEAIRPVHDNWEWWLLATLVIRYAIKVAERERIPSATAPLSRSAPVSIDRALIASQLWPNDIDEKARAKLR